MSSPAPPPPALPPPPSGAAPARLARPLHFDLTSLRLLIATAELGSVTAAAAQHHVAVTAASRRIAELEDQLGVALFKRQRHGMVPTEAGSSLLVHARDMMRACQALHLDADAFAHGDKGVIRIAACTSAVLQFLPDDIRAFQQRHPDVRIDLQESDSHHVAAVVANGQADIGVLVSARDATGLALTPYHQDELVLVVPANHALADLAALQPRIRIEQALSYDFVGLPDGTAVAQAMRQIADRHDILLRTRIRVASFGSMLTMIAAGIGIGLMPRGVASQFTQGAPLRQLLLEEPWARRELALCRRSGGELSALASDLFEFLTQSAR